MLNVCHQLVYELDVLKGLGHEEFYVEVVADAVGILLEKEKIPFLKGLWGHYLKHPQNGLLKGEGKEAQKLAVSFEGKEIGAIFLDRLFIEGNVWGRLWRGDEALAAFGHQGRDLVFPEEVKPAFTGKEFLGHQDTETIKVLKGGKFLGKVKEGPDGVHLEGRKGIFFILFFLSP